MKDHPESIRKLSPKIHRLLASLRARIRRAVLLEGLGWLIFWAAVLFLTSFAIDYLPVRFGYSELPRWARLGLLILTGVALGWVLLRYILQRLFVPLNDSSLALLIERRYPEFADSLVTTVNRADPLYENQHNDVSVDVSMLERTKLDAESRVASVDSASVVNTRPARLAISLAGVLLLSLTLFLLIAPSAFQLAGQRLYLLSDTLWPRQCRIEFVGLVVERENAIAGIPELEQMVELRQGTLRVARGSTVSMLVRAEQSDSTDGDGKRELPDKCWLNFYLTDEGTRGNQPFKRIGSPRNGFQTYLLDGAPLENMISGLEFDIVGGDDRIGPFVIEVVDEPVVKTTDLACRYPKYVVDEASGRYMDRSKRWTGEARLPRGTSVTIEANTNKPLSSVYVVEFDDKGDPLGDVLRLPAINVVGDTFQLELPPLMQSRDLKFYLCDTDGIVAEAPHEMLIEPVTDQAPVVDTRLKGIGAAVTPDVQLPISADIVDDYGVNQVRIEFENGATQITETVVEPPKNGKLEMMVDFRERRNEFGDKYRLLDEGQSQLSVFVVATDFYDLDSEANEGKGERIELDVVSEAELLRIIERLEVGQRRRLEQVFTELKEVKKYLERTRDRRLADGRLVEPGDEPGDKETNELDEEKLQQSKELRRLFAQRALLQIEKSTREIRGSANAFDDLRLQLINNRVAGTNRVRRFEEQIIGPLQHISDETLLQVGSTTKSLEEMLQQIEMQSGVPRGDRSVSLSQSEMAEQEVLAATVTVEALKWTDTAIDELNEVLDLLVKFETQNELLDIVRQMIAEQKALLERTKKQRQKQAFQGLLD